MVMRQEDLELAEVRYLIGELAGRHAQLGFEDARFVLQCQSRLMGSGDRTQMGGDQVMRLRQIGASCNLCFIPPKNEPVPVKDQPKATPPKVASSQGQYPATSRTRFSALEFDLDQANDQRQKLETERGRIDRDLSNLDAQIAAVDESAPPTELNVLLSRRKSAASDRERIEARIASIDEAAKNTQASLTALQEELTAIETEISTRETRIDAIEIETRQHQELVWTLRGEQGELRDEVAAIKLRTAEIGSPRR